LPVLLKKKKSMNEMDPVERDKRLSEKFSNLQELQLSEIDQNAIIEEQNKDMEQIEIDLRELTDCFVDMAETVQMGGEHLKQVEKNVQTSVLKVDSGTSELHWASTYLKRARVKMVIIVALILVLLFIISIAIWLGVCKGPRCGQQQ